MTREMTRITVEAPSNIALLKYWGKADEGLQWPAGDSLSMTLKNCRTITSVSSSDKEDEFWFNGTRLDLDDTRARKPLKHIEYLKNKFKYRGYLKIETSNSFPAGCGIASSASGFAALTLGVVSFIHQFNDFLALEKKGIDKENLSHLARLGSGSAGRSIFGGYVKWLKGLSATGQKITQGFSQNHWSLADSIVIVSDGRKHVSSTEAHRAAFSSPLFKTRLSGLREKLCRIETAISQRDIESLGHLIEEEALEMHAVIMTATPSISYLTHETYEVLNWLRAQRSSQGMRAFFTIDAGANVHIISLKEDQNCIVDKLSEAFPGFKIIRDEVGEGARYVND